MDKEEIMIREWEQRYESYRQYRAQYITVTSFVVPGVVLGIGISRSDGFNLAAQLVVLVTVCMVVICYIAAHIIAFPAIKNLGKCLKKLEKDLGMSDFHTTESLQRSLWVSFAGSIITVIIILLIYFMA